MTSIAAPSLLEHFKKNMNLTFLSDLCFLRDNQYGAILEIIREVPPNTYSVAEWNDTIHYMLHTPACFEEENAAKDFLLQYFAV